MPYLIDEEEEERKRKEEGESVPVTGTQAGTLPGSGGTKPIGAAPNNSFVDVQAYLQANRPQALDTAKKVAGKLGEEEQGLRTGLETVSEGYRGQVEAGTVRPDEELVGRAATDPTEFVKNAEDVEKFKRQRDASFTGPGAFEESAEAGDITHKIKTAQERARGIETSQGRKDYLTSIGKNPTAGVVSLDDLLIGGDPDARAELTRAAQPFETLGTALEDATHRASEQLSAGRGGTEAARSGVANRFTGEGGVLPSFRQSLQGRLGEERAGSQSRADLARSNLLAGGSATPDIGRLTDQDLAELGVTRGEMEAIFSSSGALRSDYGQGTNFEDFLTQQTPEVLFPNADAIASQEDYAKEAALEALLGESYSDLTNEMSGQTGERNRRLLDFNEGDARSLTSEALRNRDVEFVNQKLASTPAGQSTNLDDPVQLNRLVDILERSDDPTDRIFLNALGRLGYLRNRNKPTPPPPLPPTDPNRPGGPSNPFRPAMGGA